MAEVAPAPAPAKPKKAGPSVQELIVKTVAASKERSGVSAAALKKALAAGGYDVDKNKVRVKTAIKSLLTKGTLVHTKGTGAAGPFKMSKTSESKKPQKAAAKKAAPKAKKPAAKKPAAAKKPKAAAKKPAAAKKSPKKVKKPAAAAAKKAAKSPKKATKSPKKSPKKAVKKAPAAKKAAPKAKKPAAAAAKKATKSPKKTAKKAPAKNCFEVNHCSVSRATKKSFTRFTAEHGDRWEKFLLPC